MFAIISGAAMPPRFDWTLTNNQIGVEIGTAAFAILEAANLVSIVRRGREKLHFNPVPLHEIYERWVRKFETQRLSLLHDLKTNLEGNDDGKR